MTTSPEIEVRICTVTYLRPEGLERLLRAIEALQIPSRVRLSLIVVDNDPEGSGRAVVDDRRPHLGFPVTYEIESERGVAAVRNRALQLALADGADWIAWMDDDEMPEPQWLTSILQVQAATDADVVLGPNEPAFEPGSVDWVTTSGLLHNERFTTGESFPYFHTRTSGVLLRASQVPPEGFDAAHGLTGGEDRVFFTRMHRAGAKFVYDNDAVMHEFVPASRARPSWLLRRWYRIGVTRSMTLLTLDAPGPLRRLRRVAGGLLAALVAVGQTILSIPKGRVAVLSAVRGVMIGLGSSAGAVGLRYNEYKKVHGR